MLLIPCQFHLIEVSIHGHMACYYQDHDNDNRRVWIWHHIPSVWRWVSHWAAVWACIFHTMDRLHHPHAHSIDKPTGMGTCLIDYDTLYCPLPSVGWSSCWWYQGYPAGSCAEETGIAGTPTSALINHNYQCALFSFFYHRLSWRSLLKSCCRSIFAVVLSLVAGRSTQTESWTWVRSCGITFLKQTDLTRLRTSPTHSIHHWWVLVWHQN